MSISDIVALILAHLGAIYLLVAAIGMVRMPDVLLRLQCISAGTLGAACLLLAAGLLDGSISAWSRTLATIAFFMITAPIGAHILGLAIHHRDPMPIHHAEDEKGSGKPEKPTGD
ncbi:MAG: cation:proton antiporter [Planctomycetota bacterium]